MARASDVFVLGLRIAAARRPPMPVRVLTAGETAVAVRHAVDEGLDVGLGMDAVDDCLVLDLSGMKRFTVDPRAGTATVQPGVTIAELEDAAALYGLEPLADRGRLSVASLLEAHVVAWDGSFVRASADESPGSLGFVIEATYRLVETD
jgi:hypothetical protein